jgi:hypothetical protein
MRSLSTIIISLLCVASSTQAIHLPRVNKEPEHGKAFYTVFPKKDTDNDKTRDFVKDVIGNEDLMSWTDIKEQLISWTVEASPVEVTKLQGYAGVDKVVVFHPPKAPYGVSAVKSTVRV